MAKGTLTSFQLHIGEDTWKELVDKYKRYKNLKKQEKKFETDVE